MKRSISLILFLILSDAAAAVRDRLELGRDEQATTAARLHRGNSPQSTKAQGVTRSGLFGGGN